MRTHLAVAGLLVAVAACAGGVAFGPPSEPAPRRYSASTVVLESPDHEPMLCLGGVLESYPPQCGDVEVVGWDWDDVDGEESASGTTWGEFFVVGTLDGEVFTLTETPAPPRDAEEVEDEDQFATPCKPPDGGWAPVDPETTTQEALDAAIAHAQRQPTFADVWVDQSINPAQGEDSVDEARMNDPELLVLNVRFTDDVDRHERQLRQVWGGALCVTSAERTMEELLAIQEEIHRDVDGILGSAPDGARGVVQITVIAADEELQRSLDERYGPGVVEVTGALTPAD